jgi:hypothetical protein
MSKVAVQLEAGGAIEASGGHDFGHVRLGVERVELGQAGGLGVGGHVHANHENRFGRLIR